jgi:hypothetical protein
MKINKDGFIWLIVNDKAKEIFNSGLFALYALYPDDTEAQIESFDMLNEILEQGLDIGIEVSYLQTNTKKLYYSVNTELTDVGAGLYEVTGMKEITVYHMIDNEPKIYVSIDCKLAAKSKKIIKRYLKGYGLGDEKFEIIKL